MNHLPHNRQRPKSSTYLPPSPTRNVPPSPTRPVSSHSTIRRVTPSPEEFELGALLRGGSCAGVASGLKGDVGSEGEGKDGGENGQPNPQYQPQAQYPGQPRYQPQPAPPCAPTSTPHPLSNAAFITQDKNLLAISNSHSTQNKNPEPTSTLPTTSTSPSPPTTSPTANPTAATNPSGPQPAPRISSNQIQTQTQTQNRQSKIPLPINPTTTHPASQIVAHRRSVFGNGPVNSHQRNASIYSNSSINNAANGVDSGGLNTYHKDLSISTQGHLVDAKAHAVSASASASDGHEKERDQDQEHQMHPSLLAQQLDSALNGAVSRTSPPKPAVFIPNPDDFKHTLSPRPVDPNPHFSGSPPLRSTLHPIGPSKQKSQDALKFAGGDPFVASSKSRYQRRPSVPLLGGGFGGAEVAVWRGVEGDGKVERAKRAKRAKRAESKKEEGKALREEKNRKGKGEGGREERKKGWCGCGCVVM